MRPSPRLNSKVCEYEYELQKLSWFWLRQLRLEDPKLDWEKLKRALFEGLLFNAPPNDSFNATETPTSSKIIPPPETPDWVAVQTPSLNLPFFVTTKVIAQTQYLGGTEGSNQTRSEKESRKAMLKQRLNLLVCSFHL